jgi:REP element-mobilizing transposase RayT
MARPLRIAFPGAFYHVTARGNERKTVFKSKRDRERFLEYLETVCVRDALYLSIYEDTVTIFICDFSPTDNRLAHRSRG